jgi:hypothetical protein
MVIWQCLITNTLLHNICCGLFLPLNVILANMTLQTPPTWVHTGSVSMAGIASSVSDMVGNTGWEGNEAISDTRGIQTGHQRDTDWTPGGYRLDTRGIQTEHQRDTDWNTGGIQTRHQRDTDWTPEGYTLDTRGIQTGHQGDTDWTQEVYTLDTRGI